MRAVCGAGGFSTLFFCFGGRGRPGETGGVYYATFLEWVLLVVSMYACLLTDRRFNRVTRDIRVRRSSQRVILLARNDDDRVRGFRATIMGLIMNGVLRFCHYEIFLQVNNVSTISADTLRRCVNLSFSTARQETYVNYGMEITYTDERSSRLTVLRHLSHLITQMRLNGELRTRNYGRAHLSADRFRNKARNRAISCHDRRARLITLSAIRAAARATRSTRCITTASCSDRLRALLHCFNCLLYVLKGALIISSVLFIARR